MQHLRDLVQHVHPAARQHLQRAQRRRRQRRGGQPQVGYEPEGTEGPALHLHLGLHLARGLELGLGLCLDLGLGLGVLRRVRGSRVRRARAALAGLTVSVSVAVAPPAGMVRRMAFSASVQSFLLVLDLRGWYRNCRWGRLGGAGLWVRVRVCMGVLVRVWVRVRVRVWVCMRARVQMSVRVRLGDLQRRRSEELTSGRRRGWRRIRRLLGRRILTARPRTLDVGNVARTLFCEGEKPRAGTVVFIT